LSIIESVYTVIDLLKKSEVEHCDTKDFLIPFEKMIAYQVEYILTQLRIAIVQGQKERLFLKTGIRRKRKELLFLNKKVRGPFLMASFSF
jgi:hypothetical protein